MNRNRFDQVLRGATRVGALAAIAACADRAPMAPSLSPNDGPSALLVSGAADLAAVPGPGAATYPLYAGGGGSGPGTLVGEVRVTSTLVSGNTYAISATYDLTVGCLTETHLAVALQTSGVPQKNGNPTPGQFATKASHSCVDSYTATQNINLGATDNAVVIAAHAVVQGLNGGTPGLPEQIVASGGNAVLVTARRSAADGAMTNVGPYVAIRSVEPFGIAGNDDATISAWDNILSQTANGLALQQSGADWVWESPQASETDADFGSVVRFQMTVNAAAARAGTFRITCDNGYRLELNGATLTSGDGATAGYTTQLSTAFHNSITSNPDFKQANVSADGWQSVEAYNVNLLAGANTFVVYGVNEYMKQDDKHTGFSGGPGARPADFDPEGSPLQNPTGCIFSLVAPATPGTPGTGEETAWGAPQGFSGATTGAGITGGNFGGKNWATYFTYQVR